MTITNLTQHSSTPEQAAVGVRDLRPEHQERLRALLTFDILPSAQDVEKRAEEIAAFAATLGVETAMIGGAPFLMAPLIAALKVRWIECVFAFSSRESVETVLPDGSVRKTAVFRHAGFVPA